MNRPKFAAIGSQAQLNAGLNSFALTLVAESYGDDPKRFKGETLLAVSRAHNGTDVYMLISSTKPTAEQIESWRSEGTL